MWRDVQLVAGRDEVRMVLRGQLRRTANGASRGYRHRLTTYVVHWNGCKNKRVACHTCKFAVLAAMIYGS